MMREVFERRFGRALKEDPERESGTWPDLVLIDGGIGQLSAARDILTEMGVHDVPLVAVAKGPDRDAGREWFHRTGTDPIQLPPRDPVLYYLQRLRDEAHRFAITTHRAGRSKSLIRSELDDIPGVGSAIKRALLNHFGSARGVRNAALEDLQNSPGIGPSVARRIYEHFHPGTTGPLEAVKPRGRGKPKAATAVVPPEEEPDPAGPAASPGTDPAVPPPSPGRELRG